MTHEKQERIQGQGGATPGPWHVHPDGSTVEYETGIGGRRTLLSLNWRGPVETAANAKLIAAAPELLAVAIDAVRRCASLHGDSFETHKCPTCEPTRAAIAKALGYGAALRKAGRE